MARSRLAFSFVAAMPCAGVLAFVAVRAEALDGSYRVVGDGVLFVEVLEQPRQGGEVARVLAPANARSLRPCPRDDLRGRPSGFCSLPDTRSGRAAPAPDAATRTAHVM
jgi:hypothetical protein